MSGEADEATAAAAAMADALDAAGGGSRASARCRGCGAVVALSGRDMDEVLAALAGALLEEGWQVSPVGLRFCPTCSARGLPHGR